MISVNTKELLLAIVEGAKEKKGKNIISVDFTKLENHFCKYFVICEGDSNTHVNSIAGEIEEYTRNTTGLKPWSREGFENSEWILLDYSDIVVHIFQRKTREYYKLEELWADCKITKHSEDND